MSWPPKQPSWPAWAVAAGVALAASLAPRASGAEDRTAAATAGCAEFAVKDVELRHWAAVDEVRVIVSQRSPDAGAVRISVGSGRFDRVVDVHGNLSRGLKFTTPLTGTRFEVALDPVFEAPGSACVEEIQLLRRGGLVAAVTP